MKKQKVKQENLQESKTKIKGKDIVKQMIEENLMKIYVDNQVANILARARAKQDNQRSYIR